VFPRDYNVRPLNALDLPNSKNVPKRGTKRGKRRKNFHRERLTGWLVSEKMENHGRGGRKGGEKHLNAAEPRGEERTR